jgi:hypothetical protein
MRRHRCRRYVSLVLSHHALILGTKRLPRVEETYSSTSLRCTDFVPPHMGIVKVGKGDSAMGSCRRFRDERARARVGATKDDGRDRGSGCSDVESESRTEDS